MHLQQQKVKNALIFVAIQHNFLCMISSVLLQMILILPFNSFIMCYHAQSS